MSVFASNDIGLRMTVEALTVKVEEQAEEIRSLREQLLPPTVFPFEWRLTRSESAVLSFLLARSPHPRTKEQIAAALYRGADGGPDAKTVDVFVYKIRKKLQATGIVIENIYGHGFSIPLESASRLREIVEDYAKQGGRRS